MIDHWMQYRSDDKIRFVCALANATEIEETGVSSGFDRAFAVACFEVHINDRRKRSGLRVNTW